MKRALLFMLLTLCLAGCAALAVTPQAPDRGPLPLSGFASDTLTNAETITSTQVAPIEVTGSPTSTVVVTSTTSTSTSTVVVTSTTSTITSTISTTTTLPDGHPAIVDLGFRPFPNGYGFKNYGHPADFTISDTIKMFGYTNVCLVGAGVCYPRLEFQSFTAKANKLILGGHCEGFTITSLRYFKGLDQPLDFQSNVTTTYGLLKSPNVQNPIAYYWGLQIPDPVASAKTNSIAQKPTQILDQLIKAIGDASDPTSLFIFDRRPDLPGAQGHTIVPYAIDQVSKSIYRVWVYDNNFPVTATITSTTNSWNRYVTITSTTNTWSYNTGLMGLWSGSAATYSLGAVPLSLYSETPNCSLCRKPTGLSKPTGPGTPAGPGKPTGPIKTSGGLVEPHLIVSNDPNSQLLVTDSQGHRQGLVNGQGVEEIPGAFSTILPGGLGLPGTPIAYLPVTGTYTFTISRPAPISPTLPSEINEFGPGFVAAVSNIMLTGTQSSQLHVGADGTQVVYQSGSTDPVTFGMTVESADESKEFEVGGITVGAGRVLTLTVDDNRRRFVVNDASNVGGTYDLTYTRVTTDGQQTFFAPGIIITPTDTQFVNYDAWNGTGPITITIDSGSTGTITHTITLYNQAAQVYLPLVQK